MINLGDALIFTILFLHLLSASIWLGNITCITIILNIKHLKLSKSTTTNILEILNNISDITTTTLILTGVILSIKRLSLGVINNYYLTILIVKVIIALSIFIYTWAKREKIKSSFNTSDLQTKTKTSKYYIILFIGMVLFFLSELLRYYYEKQITS